jgi:hypothetical protein
MPPRLRQLPFPGERGGYPLRPLPARVLRPGPAGPERLLGLLLLGHHHGLHGGGAVPVRSEPVHRLAGQRHSRHGDPHARGGPGHGAAHRGGHRPGRRLVLLARPQGVPRQPAGLVRQQPPLRHLLGRDAGRHERQADRRPRPHAHRESGRGLSFTHLLLEDRD